MKVVSNLSSLKDECSIFHLMGMLKLCAGQVHPLTQPGPTLTIAGGKQAQSVLS